MVKLVLLLILAAVIVGILSFTGVEPLATYKDNAAAKISEWWGSLDNETDTGYARGFTPSATKPPAKTDVADYALIFNQYRESKGREPLVFTEDLNRIATLRLGELKTNFSHYSAGQYKRHLGENIVMGVNDNQEALECWQGSPGHNANMLNIEYINTGYAAGGGYAVQVFSGWETVNGEPILPPGWHFTD